MKDIKTRVVSAFPGTGKTFYSTSYEGGMPEFWCTDSDSSKFDKGEFPGNYIQHIKNCIGRYKIVFVSSHKIVRDALVENKIPFTLVYPKDDLKEEYLQRYRDRGNTNIFVNLLDEFWEEWLVDMKAQEGCEHIVLYSKQFISNVM